MRTELNKNKIILDLCGGTGAWSKPYRDAGYDVKLATLPDFDVRYWKNTWLSDLVFGGKVYGILVAPPCTMLSFARTKAKKSRDLKEGMKCVRACLDIIWSCMEIKQPTNRKVVSLKFWALENPNGFLKYFLGKPAFIFSPNDFGDNYQKRTHLWGRFNDPISHPVKVGFWSYKTLNPLIQKKFDCLASREIHPEMFGKLTRQERRSITPAGFAKAFFKANQ